MIDGNDINTTNEPSSEPQPPIIKQFWTKLGKTLLRNLAKSIGSITIALIGVFSISSELGKERKHEDQLRETEAAIRLLPKYHTSWGDPEKTQNPDFDNSFATLLSITNTGVVPLQIDANNVMVKIKNCDSYNPTSDKIGVRLISPKPDAPYKDHENIIAKQTAVTNFLQQGETALFPIEYGTNYGNANDFRCLTFIHLTIKAQIPQGFAKIIEVPKDQDGKNVTIISNLTIPQLYSMGEKSPH